MTTDSKMILNADQTQALKMMQDYSIGDYSSGAAKESFRLAGLAGTGKTTLLSEFIKTLSIRAQFCAFTGKAAFVLRTKGIPAQTIHKTIYRFDEYHNTYHLRDSVDCDIFVIDEAAMINKKLWEDILSFNLPIILVGDHGQLEPVGEDIYLMQSPDYTLTEVLRQAAESPILQMAYDARFSGTLPKDEGSLLEKYLSNPNPDKQIICPFNKVRVSLNKHIHPHDATVGTRIIILQNDYRAGVFNGQLMTITEVAMEEELFLYVDAIDDSGDTYSGLQLYKGQFRKHTTKRLHPADRKKLFGSVSTVPIMADFGYAITCHKSQGSEWDTVYVYHSPCDLWDDKRWAYTAITRASETLHWCEI